MILAGLFCHPLLASSARAQTDGSARVEARLNDYNGSGTKHWTVVWVTTQSGTFIKTLWRQGPSLGSSQWNSHCRVWYTAKAGSTAFDGYTSATASNYSGVNSPVILTWNCRDGSNQLVADGGYKFWIQYAEDDGQGPYTTAGLAWTKGAEPATMTYANQGTNFSNMSVTWTPVAPPPPPVITSVQLDGSNLILRGTGPAGRAYQTLFAPSLAMPSGEWTIVGSGVIDAGGGFASTVPRDLNATAAFYQVILP